MTWDSIWIVIVHKEHTYKYFTSQGILEIVFYNLTKQGNQESIPRLGAEIRNQKSCGQLH